VLVSVFIMAVVIAIIETAMSPDNGLGYVAEVVIAGGAGTTIYVMLLIALRVPEIRQMKRVFTPRANASDLAQ